jgi:hypothetical protein
MKSLTQLINEGKWLIASGDMTKDVRISIKDKDEDFLVINLDQRFIQFVSLDQINKNNEELGSGIDLSNLTKLTPGDSYHDPHSDLVFVRL